ncbi:hypothetical protein DP939_25125 [Spongiactinospora rosea]|uniref:Type II secretion system protein GspF domain-containing protein n=1 Tax=Spongiactinospora rosea TaxID=2248750 RepID=A0A366LVL9_9ACTN|nr:type II secretion system F family protein [Spongiactinospora rosea]RBQ17232.1 hypothetical protein DP939_25125 [Spongiactinospora rosea]
MTALIVLAGGLAGLGVMLIVLALRPAPVHLRATLARLAASRSARPGTATYPDGDGERRYGAGRWLLLRAERLGLPIPGRDLALLGETPAQFFTHKLLAAALGLLLPTVLTALLIVLGVALPWQVPAGAALVAAAALFFAPDWAVRIDAAARRREFRIGISTYLDLVSLLLPTGAGVNEALSAAAGVGPGWVFARIATALRQARRAQQPPWAALARLGDDVGVRELSDLAEITHTAAAEGAGVLDTVMARAESMRTAAQAHAREDANARTTTMVVPMAVLGLGFVILLMYPLMFRLLTT